MMTDAEDLWVCFNLSSFRIHLYCVYLLGHDQFSFNSFLSTFDSLVLRESDIHLLCGDFNFGSIKWNFVNNYVTPEREKHFLDVIDLFHQFVYPYVFCLVQNIIVPHHHGYYKNSFITIKSVLLLGLPTC